MINAAVIQDRYTARPAPLDETVRDPLALQRQCEDYKQAILAPQLALARQAVGQGVDLLVFREDCNGAGAYGHRIDRPDLFEALSEPIPGPTSERLAEIARAGSCYVVGCFNETLDGRIYNTALLLDPRGKPVGKYHKTHMPPLERFLVTAGDDLPVFQTEIGIIGMLICYDMMTPEAVRCLGLKGADMVCWPSLGYGWWVEAGDFTIRSRAHDSQLYILGALTDHSCIVDPSGDFLCRATVEPAALLTAEIQPGVDPVQPPNHNNAFLTGPLSLRERHLFERRPDLYGVITEPQPPLAGRYPHTRMASIEQDPVGTFERYRDAQGTLTWQTREE